MEHFYEILWSLLAVAGTALTTWLVATITNWLNKKIKDKKLADIMTSLTTLVMSVVEKTYQTVVQTLKEQNSFDKHAQEMVKANAVNEIKRQLTVEQKEYIDSLGMKVEEWISLQIEAMIYQLKK
jgi:L-lactate permease